MGPEGGTPMCHSLVLPGQSCMRTDYMCVEGSKDTVLIADGAAFTHANTVQGRHKAHCVLANSEQQDGSTT